MKQHKTLGILGGMGPLVSTEFVKAIYECKGGGPEQEWPDVILFSLPSAPDRTQALKNGGYRDFLAFLTRQLERLSPLCDRMVVPCYTAHAWFKDLPGHLRSKTISLLDVTDCQLCHASEPTLLLATQGSYQSRLFQDGCRMADLLVPLDEGDQELCARLIYQHLKIGGDPLAVLDQLHSWSEKYQTSSLLAGCTEFHLTARALGQQPTNLRLIDPLGVLACEFDQYLLRPRLCRAC